MHTLVLTYQSKIPGMRKLPSRRRCWSDSLLLKGVCYVTLAYSVAWNLRMPGNSWQESADSPCAVGQPRRVWLARANFMVLHPRKTRLSARIVLSTAAVLDCEMQFVRLNSHKKEERERRVYLGKEQGISIHRTRRERIKESDWGLLVFLSPFHKKT